jgi:superfamily I DNA/RNA helicase
MKSRSLLTFEGAIHEARLAVEQRNFTRYAHILVDEVQEFGLEALHLIHAISPGGEGSPDPLCIAGDGHQRIYRYKVPMSRAGIDIRGRSRRLKINYRTSQQIRNYAHRILTGMKIDDLDG